MATRRAGFADDPATQGYDLTQGYRDYSPRFDQQWVKDQVAPYKGAGLDQNVSDYADKSSQQLYDMAAAAVIKLARQNGVIKGGGGNNPPPTTPPGRPPKPPKPPKPKPPKQPKPRKPKPPKPGRLPGTSPIPRPPHERDPFPNG